MKQQKNTVMLPPKREQHVVVGGSEHEFHDLPSSWESSSQLTIRHIFQRGR
jgi:hypothetical protein